MTIAEWVAGFHADASGRVLPGIGQPEAQLAAPVEDLLKAAGSNLAGPVSTYRETSEPLLRVRPDLGVSIAGLLTGHVELKAPGKGADPARFTDDHDRTQWSRLRELPNLVLTDGVEWALYRNGVRQLAAALPALSATPAPIDPATVGAIDRLLREFFSWKPIVPGDAEQLAEVLAPLARVTRDEVLAALGRSNSAISQLARDWRQVLFPDASDRRFADSYAQTLTYALLLARLDPTTAASGVLSTSRASEVLETGHGLLAQALRVLSEPTARAEIATGVGLLERAIGAVDASRVAGTPSHDVWLYFYECFLQAYDPQLREDLGVYYTPAEVVGSQVQLVGELLRDRFGKTRSYADDDVVLLDPAVGTGTYPLRAIDHALEVVSNQSGPGAVAGRADTLASNVHAFEVLVGPYTVAHLRITQRLRDAGASLGPDAVRVYLADTLESPDIEIAGQIPLALRRLSVEHERARAVKTDTRVLVCMGNPPYKRQAFDATSESAESREAKLDRLLGPILGIARDRTMFSHLASLYNLYVYFWRWALWKVFDSTGGPGIVSFISASSYMRAPGFKGMREVMRRTFDELWVIDLGGDNRGARQTENVFNIETPVAIAIGVRYGQPNPDTAAVVHYCEIDGTRAEKLAALDAIQSFADLAPWTQASTGWDDSLIPVSASTFGEWPLITNLFPWQTPGVKVGRTWPIGVTDEVLAARWRVFAGAPKTKKPALLPDRKYGRKSASRVGPTLPPAPALDALAETTSGSERAPVVRYGYRSLVRHYLLADPRVIDLQRPPLWQAHSDHQIYLASLLTQTVGDGPAASITSLIPDLHFYRGSFGGKDVIPLWRDSGGQTPNVDSDALRALEESYGMAVPAEDFFAYAAALLGNARYTELFRAELATSSLRLPLTADPEVFTEVVALGRELIRIETFGERFAGSAPGVRRGTARALTPVPATPHEYPREFAWDADSNTLSVGSGTFGPIAGEVWEFELSGLRPLRHWLGYRMREPAGKTSSPLDAIGPASWTPGMTDELLELLWTLEQVTAIQPLLGQALEAVVAGPLIGFRSAVPADSPLRSSSDIAATAEPSLWEQPRSTSD
jgi:hypothetical protein